MAGNEEAIWTMVGSEAANSEEYTSVLEQLKEQGVKLPDGIAEGMESNTSSLFTAAQTMKASLNTAITSAFSTGIDVSIPVNLDLQASTSSSANYALADPYGDVAQHADGGIFDTPHFGLVAEAGPEAIVPLNGSQDSIDIWKSAGSMLGLYDDSNFQSEDSFSSLAQQLDSSDEVTNNSTESNSQIAFSPTINFYGSTPSDEDVTGIVNTMKEQIEEYINQLKRDHERTAFG